MPSIGINESWSRASKAWATCARIGAAPRRKPGGDMCKLLARQDPRRFTQTSRSLRISGQSTSIRLETAFWEILDAIAAGEGMSVSRLVASLYDEAVDLHGEVANFASLLRTVCLIYQGERAEMAIRRHPPA
jgi:predicted DNA-binding ribbon-helix-helix protein